jgi:membrane-associated phospholipid phosphatase
MSFSPSEPPSFDSVRTLAELREVRTLLSTFSPTELADLTERWNRAPSIPWNEIACELVAENRLNPPEASRVYALLGIAQYDALILSARGKEQFARHAPAQLDPTLPMLTPPEALSAYPSHHGAVAAASRGILAHFFPLAESDLDKLFHQHLVTRLVSGVSLPSDLGEGVAIGSHVASEIRRYCEARPIPSSESPIGSPMKGGWTEDSRGALHPRWGTLEPLLLGHPAQFRPGPPPELDSAVFREALDEVRALALSRTPEQLAIAERWAGGPGTPTPPGQWNVIARSLIERYEMEDVDAARVFAYLNAALFDAGISCWETKYTYGLLRPSQADPAISTPVGLPPFPAYTSGHATFSGAAAEVLGYFFPQERERLNAMAAEAALSRVYGGIHYRFDGEQGLEVGRRCGALAIKRAKTEE